MTTSRRRRPRSPFAVRRRRGPASGNGGNGAAATILHLSFFWVLLSLVVVARLLTPPIGSSLTAAATKGGKRRVGFFCALSSSWGAVHAFTTVTPYYSRAAAGDVTFRRGHYYRGDDDDDKKKNDSGKEGTGWTATIDKDDGHASLDRFESVLHESLRRIATATTTAIAATAADGTVHDPPAVEVRPRLGAEEKARNEGMGMGPVAAFQSLTIDFDASRSTLSRATAGNKTKKKQRLPEASSTPTPVPGSLRKITGRIVLLSSSKTSTKSNKKKSKLDPYVLHVTHKYHGATDIVKNYPFDDAAHIITELLEWWARTAARRTAAERDRHQDGDIDEGAIPATVASIATEWGVHHLLGSTVSVRGRIDTTSGRHVLSCQVPATATAPLRWSFRNLPSLEPTKASTKTPGASAAAVSPLNLGHDRAKDRKVRVEDEFWKAVGVTATAVLQDQPRVSVKPDKIGKVRQCEKFVEIVDQLLQDVVMAGPDDASDGDTTPTSSVRITDLGCGKGYLTYALHSYLQRQLRYSNVTSIGVDIRPKLVQELNRIASDLSIEGLRFEQGSIQDACLGDHHRDEDDAAPATAATVDVVIALHACDTATDDALHVALQRGADVIVTAPCCHKQLRPQINDLILGSSATRRRSSTGIQSHPLSDVLRHGIYRERTAETVTDSLRAMLLELAGYQTNVFEFVGGEHTAKNCMITAVRHRRSSHNDHQEAVRNRIRTLAEFYGIRSHKLAEWMGEQELLLAPTRDVGTDPSSSSKRSMGSMPPL